MSQDLVSEDTNQIFPSLSLNLSQDGGVTDTKLLSLSLNPLQDGGVTDTKQLSLSLNPSQDGGVTDTKQLSNQSLSLSFHLPQDEIMSDTKQLSWSLNPLQDCAILPASKEISQDTILSQETLPSTCSEDEETKSQESSILEPGPLLPAEQVATSLVLHNKQSSTKIFHLNETILLCSYVFGKPEPHVPITGIGRIWDACDEFPYTSSSLPDIYLRTWDGDTRYRVHSLLLNRFSHRIRNQRLLVEPISQGKGRRQLKEIVLCFKQHLLEEFILNCYEPRTFQQIQSETPEAAETRLFDRFGFFLAIEHKLEVASLVGEMLHLQSVHNTWSLPSLDHPDVTTMFPKVMDFISKWQFLAIHPYLRDYEDIGLPMLYTLRGLEEGFQTLEWTTDDVLFEAKAQEFKDWASTKYDPSDYQHSNYRDPLHPRTETRVSLAKALEGIRSIYQKRITET